jgi:hypothetical protein
MTLQIFQRSGQAGSVSPVSMLQAMQVLVQNAAGERPVFACAFHWRVRTERQDSAYADVGPSRRGAAYRRLRHRLPLEVEVGLAHR